MDCFFFSYHTKKANTVLTAWINIEERISNHHQYSFFGVEQVLDRDHFQLPLILHEYLAQLNDLYESQRFDHIVRRYSADGQISEQFEVRFDLFYRIKRLESNWNERKLFDENRRNAY